jgi:proteic killer suppression protein
MGLKRLYEDDDSSALPARVAEKLKKMLAVLEFADDLSQVKTVPGWKLHPLKGNRKGEYSLTVTGNWRLTFRLEGRTISELNFEDYH